MVRRKPSSKSTLAVKPNRSRARLVSNLRLGWPLGFVVSHTSLPLDGNPRARDYFGTLDSRNRYAILLRIQTAKKAETRAKKIAQFVQMLARHERLHA